MELTERLAALEEIRRLKATYFRCVDLKDWSGLGEVFAADAEFDRTPSASVRDPWTPGGWSPPLPTERRVCAGREAIVDMIRAVVGELRTAHHGHSPEIELTDADTAQGVWAMQDRLMARDGRLILTGAGHYHDRYARIGGRWRIKTSRLERLYVERPTPGP